MLMKGAYKNAIRFIILLVFTLIVGVVPIILLYVGTKEPGINLQIALGGQWTLNPFVRLFSGTNYLEISFRDSLYRSIGYSTVVACISTILAVFYSNWVTGWSKKTAIGISFTLLCLTLLPLIYLIMPLLFIIHKILLFLPRSAIIILALLICVLPLCFWVLHMMEGPRINKLQEMCALDRYGLIRSLKRIVSEIRVSIVLVFLLSWAIAWGNYLVPFALGSRDTYSAAVQITTFSSNLGRDWAMICASGFIVCIPGIIIGISLWIMTNKRARGRV